MTMLIKLENGVPVGNPILESNFRQAFPEFNLPALIRPEDVEPQGYGLYDFSNQPTLGKYQKAVEITPVKNELGVWKQTWSAVDMNDLEKVEADNKQSDFVRMQRNHFLFQCDWTQVADAPVDQAAWATYRQALRDITKQEGFPWDINWPVAP